MIEAKQIFEDMLKRKITPDAVVYDIMIKGYLQQNNEAAIADLLEEMGKRGFSTASCKVGRENDDST